MQKHIFRGVTNRKAGQNLEDLNSGKLINQGQSNKKNQNFLYSYTKTDLFKIFYVWWANLGRLIEKKKNSLIDLGQSIEKIKTFFCSHTKTEISRKIWYFYLKTKISKNFYTVMEIYIFLYLKDWHGTVNLKNYKFL